jgi:hypothetical protein
MLVKLDFLLILAFIVIIQIEETLLTLLSSH